MNEFCLELNIGRQGALNILWLVEKKCKIHRIEELLQYCNQIDLYVYSILFVVFIPSLYYRRFI